MTYSIWKRLLVVFVGTLVLGIGLAFAFQYAGADAIPGGVRAPGALPSDYQRRDIAPELVPHEHDAGGTPNDDLLSGVVSILANTPAFSGDREEPAVRSARLRIAADAIVGAARAEAPRANLRALELAADLTTVGQHETTWAQYVAEGRCKDGPPGMQCDPDAAGNAQALTYWQLWRSSCPEAWAVAPGAEQVMRAAHCAARRLVEEREQCFGRHPKGVVAGMFGGYAGRCDWKPAAMRVKTREAFVRVLELGRWPRPRDGFAPVGRRSQAERRAAQALLSEPVGTWREMDVDGRPLAALVTFHWRELSAPVPPRGWHIGVSLYERLP